MAIVGEILLGFFAISATVSAIAFLTTSKLNAVTMAAGFALFLFLIAALLWFLFWQVTFAKRRAAIKIDRLADDAQQWLEAASGTLVSPPDTGTFIVPKGQSAVLSELTTCYEFRSNNARAYMGTRLKVGNLPLYVGSARTLPNKSLRKVCPGRLVLTDDMFFFLGAQLTASIALTDLIGVEPSPNFIVVSSRARITPYIFSVSNPVLWAAASRALTEGKLKPATEQESTN
jgi:hypothetical protein